MLRHVLGITGVTAAIMLCTVMPFLPGAYDVLAKPLLLMALFFGKAALLLVPAGAFWIASRYWRPLQSKERVFAIAGLVVSFLVWAIMVFAAFMASTLWLSLFAIVLGAWTAFRVIRRPPTPQRLGVMPFYLVVVPVVVAVLQGIVAGPAAEFSRTRAIDNSAALIADIEQYRVTHGRYPLSLMASFEDYWPRVIGIEKYHYEPNGESYNLFFEQASFQLGTQEFVMYNPRDEQTLASHKMDRLVPRGSGVLLEEPGGYYAVHAASRPHWKYFLFD